MEAAPRFAPAPPRVLLVEDDPVSQHYLQACLESMGLAVDIAADAHTARQLAGSRPHAVWMIDVNLPDDTGPSLLDSLRKTVGHTPALAHTADRSPALAATLCQAGFSQVLVKPLDRPRIQQALSRWLPAAPLLRTVAVSETPPVWDDAHALRALNGQQQHVAMLRGLFLGELPAIRERVAGQGTTTDTQHLLGDLHRLRASCGLVGALGLDRAVEALQRQPDDPQCREHVIHAIDALMQQ